jgi:putative transposase
MKHLAGHYYHIYNRGVNRKEIFACNENYRFLLRRINQFVHGYAVRFIAYCLMPNHYHFLLRVESDGAISPFIQRLFNSYTQAFNRQQRRSGTLFEGRPKSKLVDDEKYVLHLARYIHLNPVRKGLVDHPRDWPYSNYREWVGIRAGKLYDPEFVQAYFPNPKLYEDFVLSEISAGLETQLSKYYLE